MTNFAAEIELINASGLFDRDWYLSRYADVAMSKLDPVFHYLALGADLARDPGPHFDTSFYRTSNPDVAASGINPLVHYIAHGQREHRPALPVAPVKDGFTEKVDIVVPVYNALEDVKHCLRAIESHQDGFLVRAIVVNDGSNEDTTLWLREFCGSRALFQLIEHEGNKGYTQAVNTGLRATSAPYAITLNSDTIVTRGWLKGMVRCVNSDPRLGIVGPLSNAASWQNVPDLLDETGSFAVNVLPETITPDDMAQLVAKVSKRTYPRTPFINGFCFLIKRAVIDAVGFMDELNFPVGYGEENDFCIRAADAGYTLAIADDVYVFHAKSKSFGHSKRKELSRQGSESLKRKHTAEKFDRLVKEVKNVQALEPMRKAVKDAMQRAGNPLVEPVDLMSMKILFLLPVRGGSGGAHSVVQEVAAMRSLGVRASVAVRAVDHARFLDMYADIPNAHELFVGFDAQNLLELAFEYDVAVGTIFGSMSLIKEMAAINPWLLPAYYVQDYEPLFFPEGSDNWKVAHDSYTLVPNATLFAKTDWIIHEVVRNHGVEVHKVSPSIDHVVYRPQPRIDNTTINIAAMIRPQTPRRGAERTMRLLSRINAAYTGKLSFSLFGCDPASAQFQELPRNFPFTNHGILNRPGVTALLGQADIFIDLSDYQAFGRTALEAMACGCTAMVPVHGGTDEYAIDNVNTLVVDTFNEEECFERLDALLSAPGKLAALKHAGLLCAARFSVEGAALSELVMFSTALARHRAGSVQKIRRTLALVPAMVVREGSDELVPSGAASVRLLTPYLSAQVRKEWRVSVTAPHTLPAPGTAEVAILQREVAFASREELLAWSEQWRAAHGRIVLEIDEDLFHSDIPTGSEPPQATRMRWLAALADMVIVSTEQLARAARAYNAQVSVVPNFLDAGLWKLDRPRDHSAGPYARGHAAPITIGYIGTSSYAHDMAVVEDVMQRLKTEYGDLIEIEVIGVFQKIPATFGTRVPLPRKNDYRNFVEWLHQRVNWDIGIIPLVDNGFNRSKSSLKFLEYAALNMAIVCSDMDGYRDVARNGENAIVVENNSEAWYAGIKSLIENDPYRLELASRARADVTERFTIEANAGVYLAALTAAAAVS